MLIEGVLRGTRPYVKNVCLFHFFYKFKFEYYCEYANAAIEAVLNCVFLFYLHVTNKVGSYPSQGIVSFSGISRFFHLLQTRMEVTGIVNMLTC